MERQKFDVIWKIALLVVLLIAIFYMFYEYKQMGKEGLTCIQSPFEWGKMKAEQQGVYCSYQCLNKDKSAILFQVNFTNFSGLK